MSDEGKNEIYLQNVLDLFTTTIARAPFSECSSVGIVSWDLKVARRKRVAFGDDWGVFDDIEVDDSPHDALLEEPIS